MANAPLPRPPAHLRLRVTGTEDEKWFDDSGLRTVSEWERALNAVGSSLTDPGSILDFGCGCGRVLRHLKASGPQTLSGADVDEEAINWIRNNLEGVTGIHLPSMAPSEISPNAFDTVLSQSVFTHLPENVQFGWLEEVHRIMKPNGIFLTSIHGPMVAQKFFRSRLHLNRPDEAERFLERYSSLGFYYREGRTAAESDLPDYYGHAFHNIKYIEQHWLPGRFFLLAYLPAASLALQDILVLKKR